jgi:DNA excision repair protein ERCC-4
MEAMNDETEMPSQGDDRPVIVYDHRERRSGIPQRLGLLGLRLEARGLGGADYVLSPRLAVVRKSEAALVPWVTLGRFERAIDEVCDAYPAVVLVLQRKPGAVPDGIRHGVMARLARRGVATLVVDDADEAAAWIARLARQEEPVPGVHAGSLGRKPRDPDRIAEELLARLPGVSYVGARRLLEHFGSIRELAAASAEEIRAVRGFGPKRAAAVESALAHRRDTDAVAA